MGRRLVAAVAALLLCLGCSNGDRPELGQVRGRVTLDGRPLSGAGILFVQPGFRPSTGQTDEDGYYELTYLRDIKGAAVGTHEVRIDRIPTQEGMATEHLPARYNRESELTREVKPGSNTINFELESE